MGNIHGELIVPIKIKNISVSKDGDLTEDYYDVGKSYYMYNVIWQNLYT